MRITALAGGVGGAKLVQGLAEILSPDELTIVVNTGDDFEHLGLYICPDLDTVCYTLAGIANPITGWGIRNDTYSTFNALASLGGPAWFKLGDLDLATHLMRTHMISQGTRLTEITAQICSKIGVRHPVLPMSDNRVSTQVDTENMGLLPFQHYFVKNQWKPKVKGFIFKGIEIARPTQEVKQAILTSDAIIFCPSNPFVSIDPILALRGLRNLVDEKFVLCVSPIIKGRAVKGPLAKIFKELGYEPSAKAVIEHYAGIVDCMIIEPDDLNVFKSSDYSSIIIHGADILIKDKSSRIHLARKIIEIIKKEIQR